MNIFSYSTMLRLSYLLQNNKCWRSVFHFMDVYAILRNNFKFSNKPTFRFLQFIVSAIQVLPDQVVMMMFGKKKKRIQWYLQKIFKRSSPEEGLISTL